MEPGELLGVSPGSKLCATFLNIAKYFKTLRCGCVYFSNLLKTSTVKYEETEFDKCFGHHLEKKVYILRDRGPLFLRVHASLREGRLIYRGAIFVFHSIPFPKSPI